MSRYGGWAPYVPVAARQRRARREMDKLRKEGRFVAPVIIEGRTIAATFWGKAWCQNLESYHDFENRLPRGRSYVRNGSVLDLQITPLAVNALVIGSSVYTISVRIAAVPKPHWQSICRDCTGGIDSLVELLQGRFSKAVMERICRQDKGLFPRPSEIKFSCSCPDFAAMCKHVAAVLYGVGARLDENPELLFRLRAVDENDLLANLGAGAPLSKTVPGAGKILAADDVSALFGLEMADGDTPAVPEAGARKKVRTRPKPVMAKKSPSPQPAAKRVRLRQAGKPALEPIEGVAPLPAIQTATPAKRARRGATIAEPVKIPRRAPAKPGSKKVWPVALKAPLQLTQDGFVKWWE
ncbi:MAG: SWIM zinc finger family protein [Stellaceae bacterium]